MNRRSSGIKIIVFVFLLVAGFFAYRKLPVQFLNDANISSDTAKEDLGISVETAPVRKVKLEEKISYIGTLHPKDTVQVHAGIPAEILYISMEEGEYVRQGETVAKLDDENITARLNTLQAKIDTIEFNLGYLKEEEKKYRILFESSAISKADYDKISHETGMVEMQLKELYAQRDEIAVSLKDTVVTAPMSGVVREVNYSPGDLTIMGKPMAIIDDRSVLVVKVSISESDLEEIKVGTPVMLEIAGRTDKLAAKVTKVLPSMNPKTRIGEVEIEVKKWDKGYPVIFGTSVKTEFINKSVDDALIVPQSALKQLADGHVLYRIVDGQVYETPIEIGIRSDNQVQVINGLSEGDKVVASNIDELYDGAKVYVFERKYQ